MDKLKPMPEREKFQHVLDMLRQYQKSVLPFVEDRLGFETMHNLRSVWQAAITPIREGDSDHDKYEQAYNNWLWIARCSHNSLADQLSTEEVLDYKRMLLRMYVQHYNPDLAILHLLKAYTTLGKALLYEMQWLTPVNSIKIDNKQVIGEISECRLLQIPGAERVCRVDCQHIGKAYASQVYRLKRVNTISDHGCTITLTPIH